MFGKLFRRKPATVVINATTHLEFTDERLKAEHDKRVSELLGHNNTQLIENRALKAVLRNAAAAVGANDLGAAREILGEYADVR